MLCDANVIYKNLLRDLLVRLALAGLFSPRWTAQIHEEWIRNLLEHRPDLQRSGLERTRDLMNAALPDAQIAVTGNCSVILPDPDDLHVLNAALSCQANYLLTFNLNDFPTTLLPEPLRVIHPDAFLQQLFLQCPNVVMDTLHALRADLKKPPMSAEELLPALLRAEVPEFAAQLRPFLPRL